MSNSSAPPPEEDDEDQGQSFVSHLVELRSRLLPCVLAVLVVFLGLLYFAADIYVLLAEPLMRHLPEGATMIATEVASPFLTPFKLTLVLSIFICIPYLLYQLWAFIAPGLYRHERALVLPLVVSSTLLFYAGLAFAYFLVFPVVFGFFTSVAPAGVTVMTDIARYLDFVLKLFVAFGLAFEVPIATILMVKSGFTTVEALKAKRPYVVIGAFVIGGLLTPPDVVSQTLLAIPMWVLFELGIVFARLLVAQSEAREAAVESADQAGDGSR